MIARKLRAASPLVVAAIVGASLLAGSVSAAEMLLWRIGTGSAGGTYFPIGSLVANAISSPPGSRSCEEGGSCGVPGLVAVALSTNASVANVRAVNDGTLEAGLAGADTVYEAYNGLGAFRGQPLKSLRVIANLFPEELHLVLPRNTGIAGLADLKGKRIGVGQKGSGTRVAVGTILDIFGVTKGNSVFHELNNAESADWLASERLDAYFYIAGTPISGVDQLARAAGLELYKLSSVETGSILAAIPFFVEAVIPAGTYRGVDYAVPTVAVSAQLVVSEAQPDDLVEAVTRALWNESSKRLFDGGHAKGKHIRLESALDGVRVPLHNGTSAFYSEMGITQQ